jgi:hypothetical protein
MIKGRIRDGRSTSGVIVDPMGVWGTAVFSDDHAADLRDDYRRMIGDGLSGPEATDRLLKGWMPSPDKDPDMAALFWVALAVTQWKCGRLEDRVKQEAIRVIDDGSALRLWRGRPLERKRAAVLEASKKQLESPQPPLRKIQKVFRSSCDWEPGELIAYRLLSGSLIVLQVIRHHTDAGGATPVCEIFDWQGPELPQPGVFEGLPMRAQIPFAPKNSAAPAVPQGPAHYRLMIGQAGRREFPEQRIVRMNAKCTIQHPAKPRGAVDPTLVSLWRWLDRDLERHYGLR